MEEHDEEKAMEGLPDSPSSSSHLERKPSACIQPSVYLPFRGGTTVEGVPVPPSTIFRRDDATCISAITTPMELVAMASMYPRIPSTPGEETEIEVFSLRERSLYPRPPEESPVLPVLSEGSGDGFSVPEDDPKGEKEAAKIPPRPAKHVAEEPVAVGVHVVAPETPTRDPGTGTGTTPSAVPGAFAEGGSSGLDASVVTPSQSAGQLERPPASVPNSSSPVELVTANVVSTVDSLQVAQALSLQPKPPESISFALFYGMLMIGILVVTLAVVVGVVLTTNRDGSPTPTAPPSGRSQEEIDSITTSISAAMDISYLTSQSPSWIQGMEWILYKDPMRLSPLADNLVQRFFLAYFYFSTSQERPWSTCNPPESSSPSSSRNDSLCYYQHLTGEGVYANGYSPHWLYGIHETMGAQWLTGRHECLWAGLVCSQDQTIQVMQLEYMNLTGTFPTGITVLSNLRSLSFAYNMLRGSLPESLANLKNLTFLDLQSNQFSGTVPDGWWQSKHMKRNLGSINLSVNPLSPWSLPAAIDGWSMLENLILEDVGITGPLPEELYKLSHLEWLGIWYNSITGTVATEIGLLTNLYMLSVSNNLITGTLPSELALLTRVVEFDFWETQLTGSIPEELYFGNFKDLDALIFGFCQFSGTISTHIAELSTLRYLLLDGNAGLVGTIPSEIGLLSGLYKITVSGTSLSGTMPQELCDLRGEKTLARVKADCSQLSNGTTPLVCPVGCCTNCCNPETGICLKTGY